MISNYLLTLVKNLLKRGMNKKDLRVYLLKYYTEEDIQDALLAVVYEEMSY